MDRLPLAPSDEKPWYHQGLRFSCTGCGRCCTGAPGYVWVTAEEIATIAAFLEMTVEAFCQRYVRRVGDSFSLSEEPGSYDCSFLEGGKRCRIYPVRPIQCQTFPWWPQTLASPESWQEAANCCEGIDGDGAPLVPLEQIEAALTRNDG